MKMMYEVRYEIKLGDWVGVEASSEQEARRLVEKWAAMVNIKDLPSHVYSDAHVKTTDWTESSFDIRKEFNAMTFVN